MSNSGRLVVIGEIVRTYGLRGEVRVRALTDEPQRFERLKECVLWDATRDQREPCRIARARCHGDGVVVVAVAGCDTVDAAQALVGRLMAVAEADALPLAPGRFYPWHLEGARVVTEDGGVVGEVTAIEHGAGQEWWIVRGNGREHMIPAVADIVVEVDLAARRVVIRPPEGLLEL